MRSSFFYGKIICLFFCALSIYGEAQIKIACVGASITYGYGLANPRQDSYPAQLQTLLGNKYIVSNYGVSGATLLRKGDLSYWNTNAYQEVLSSQPDILLIDLGGNDSKLINRIHLDEYEKDYHDMIHAFAALSSHPRIILLLPIPSFVLDTTGISDHTIVSDIIPHIQNVAYNEHVEVMNMHDLLIDQSSHIPDNI